jgi:hypothetical protein
MAKNQFTQALQKMEEAWLKQEGNSITYVPTAIARGHLNSSIRKDKMRPIRAY